MTNDQLKTILDGDAGAALKDFILEERNRLGNIYTIKDCESPEAQALEFKSQRKALIVLDDILHKIMTYSKDVPEKEGYHNLP